MPSRLLHVLAVLILVIGSSPSVLGCSKSKDPTIALSGDSPNVVATGIRQRIEQAVEDTTRRDALMDDMDEIDAALAELSKTLLFGLDTLARDDVDRAKRKDDFLTTHAAIRQARNDAIRRYVDIRMQMRDLLTEEEWNRISAGVPR